MPSGIGFLTSKEAGYEENLDVVFNWFAFSGERHIGLAQGTRSTEEAVIRLEEQWFHAQATNDPALLAPLLADKAVITGSEPKVTSKSDALAICKNIKWDNVRLTDMNLAVFGDTVVATGDFKGEGTDALGKSFGIHERWTHTWVRMRSGQWQCVASHVSRVTM